MVAPEDIPPDYYLTDFETLLGWVQRHDFHLLSEAERARVAQFERLPRNARMLGLRLLNRTGSVARRGSLDYGEIEDQSAAYQRLCEEDFFVEHLGCVDLAGAAYCVTKYAVDELRAAATVTGLSSAGKKPELCERVATSPEAVARLVDQDPPVAFRERPLFKRLVVLFFGNRWQSMSSFVIAELEHVRHPSYEIARDPPLFPSREHLEAYITASERAELGIEGLDVDALVTTAAGVTQRLAGTEPPPAHRRHVDPSILDASLGLDAARELERHGRAEVAHATYEAIVEHGPEAPVRAKAVERIGIMARKRNSPACFVWARDLVAGATGLDAASRHRIHKRAFRLGLEVDPDRALRRPEEIRVGLPRISQVTTRQRWASAAEGATTVEIATLEALGGEGIRSENLLVRSLFNLLLWDVVFAPVPGAFQHPFQSAPLDFATPHFAHARETILQRELSRLRGCDLGEEAAKKYDAHVGESSPWVRWDIFERETFVSISRLLGAPFVDVLAFIAQHPRRHTRGFPDLLFWTAGIPRFVEVKGPTDTLRLEQRLIHDLLLRVGYGVAIARVTESVDAGTREHEAPPASE